MEPLHILIADDHPLFRKGMRTLLESLPDFMVVGEAATGQEAVDVAASLQPDVVLMDLQMPDGGGLTATRELRKTSPHIRILVVTLFSSGSVVTIPSMEEILIPSFRSFMFKVCSSLGMISMLLELFKCNSNSFSRWFSLAFVFINRTLSPSLIRVASSAILFQNTTGISVVSSSINTLITLPWVPTFLLNMDI